LIRPDVHYDLTAAPQGSFGLQSGYDAALRRTVMRYAWSVTLVGFLVSPAIAGWDTKSYIDRLDNRKAYYAELSAKDASATLFVGCLNGEIFPDIHFPSRISDDRVEVNYQFDDGPAVFRETNVSPEGTSLWLWLISGRETVQRIRKSKRLRLEVEDRKIEFDLTGADQALAPIHCF
jgi:hypothetical protein